MILTVTVTPPSQWFHCSRYWACDYLRDQGYFYCRIGGLEVSYQP